MDASWLHSLWRCSRHNWPGKDQEGDLGFWSLDTYLPFGLGAHGDPLKELEDFVATATLMDG